MIGHPIRMRRIDRAPGYAARPVDLAALHREHDVVGARIAGDQLILGAEHILISLRPDIRIGARTFAAELRRLAGEIGPGLDRRRVPGEADRIVVGDAAEPGELAAVELGFVDQRRNAHAARERTEHRAVLRRGGENVIGGTQAAGACHISAARWSDCPECVCRNSAPRGAHRRRSRRRRYSR